jgi:guanine deaminase
MTASERRALRGEIVSFDDDPRTSEHALRHFADGLVVLEEGRVASVGDAAALLPALPPATPVEDYRGRLILPGFVDLHVHYAQTDIIASHGEQLPGWLERYAFPAERGFGDPRLARETAEFFLGELLRNGTTCAAVYATVHPQSADAIFAAAAARRMRLIAGKVMMDRNCPAFLCDTAQSSYDESKALIARWHGRGRLAYAVTPRFAATSSEAQLEAAGSLLREHPGVLMQTHVAENRDEVALVRRLFPSARNYVDVYDRFGLLASPAVLAHGIWLDDAERLRLAAGGAAIAFCPSSNLFLGSGLFSYAKCHAAGVCAGLATDVGAGTSLSMLRTMHEAHKVAQLLGEPFDALDGFYLATLGAARALGKAEAIGSIAPGREADLVVLDPAATPLMARRMARAETLEERLFALMMLGDERAVAAAYVLGEAAWRRSSSGLSDSS